MKRRTLLAAVPWIALAGVPFAREPLAPRRVGVLVFGDEASARDTLQVFRASLGELGQREGQSFSLEVRYASAQPGRLEPLARELAERCDVIVPIGPAPAVAVHATGTRVPIVFIGTADPVGVGLVANLSQPGANITGVATLVPGGFEAKWLQLLLEIVPTARRIALFQNPDNPIHRASRPAFVKAAELLGVALTHHAVRDASAIVPAVDAAAQEKADAILIAGDPVTNAHSKPLAERANGHRLPTFFLFRHSVRDGGTASYGPMWSALVARGATLVDRVLKGAAPGTLAVEQPTRFELVVNQRTAAAIGLAIPQAVLIRADEVLQ